MFTANNIILFSRLYDLATILYFREWILQAPHPIRRISMFLE